MNYKNFMLVFKKQKSPILALKIQSKGFLSKFVEVR